MKRILFITPYIPRETNAGAAYSKQLLEELAKSFIIDVVYFRQDVKCDYLPKNSNIKIIAVNTINKWSRFRGFLLLPWLFPIFTCRFSLSILRKLKNRVYEVNYDFLYFDFSQTFAYARFLKHPNKILMSHDVIGQKYTRKKRFLLPWVKMSEKSLLKEGNAIFTFSPKDCSIIKESYNLKSDYTTFFLNENVQSACPSTVKDNFVFFGAWNRSENKEALQWFLDCVYPSLKGEKHFVIIGGGLPEEIKNMIHSVDDIEYLGFVDNPYPIIADAKAMIAPLHSGAGVKVKCIEAMACGTAVIGTEIAFEGISEEYNDLMHLAVSPDDYVKAINVISPKLEEKQAAKRRFVSTYNQKKVLDYINGTL